MTDLITVFEPICREVEGQIKGALGGLAGIVVKSYLPQHWIFVTETETVTFAVDSKGNASVANGTSASPDVIIGIDHKYLTEALKTRTRPSFDPKTFDLKFHTAKGRTAFNFIRKRLGL
ncbi:MAG: hypothetical protein KKH41_06210 [Candidatus Thermoplasmatota archaeon]|nr:hypothetical protein [Euryarchaeota archaeon]MBU4032351.1 hypothetical protein [Candidatus Thermoplasmatota archaeon]MBU4071155.1 hypothetical protein [Candidatus Thermoplasmatota archaeon]MBU4144848.1 hypothetical protein [Candidatus Thermoplasmatota archaeon]MBU4592161.1 hypothetical protein [Candidatus Thermoplasmatota archaeon]